MNRRVKQSLIGGGAAAFLLAGVGIGLGLNHQGPATVLFQRSDVATPARTENPTPNPNPPPVDSPAPAPAPTDFRPTPNPNGNPTPPVQPVPATPHATPNGG